MKQFYLLAAALLVAAASQAQTNSVGIGTTTPDPKAALDISATGKGLLIPRMDSATRAQIASPPDGLMVFQTDGRKGFWYAFGNAWLYIPDKTKSGDNLGNHTATQNLRLNGQWLGNDGGNEGISVDNSGNVGIGVAAPNARLDLGAGALMLSASIGNGATRPPANTSRVAGEIGSYGLGSGARSPSADDGFLRLSAGGGTNANTKSYIDLTGYSAVPDMNQTIALGTGGSERVRVQGDGRVGIGITAPALTLDVSETLGLRNSAAWDHLYFSHDGGTAFANAGGAENGLALRVGTGSSGSYGGQTYTEIMRLRANGRVGIGTTDPQQQLHVAGNIAADGPLGLMLAAADRPLVTRGWDAFTSGTYQGIGRWGVFMESNNLTFGVPALSGKQFQWVRYNTNSTVASSLMSLTQEGNLQVAGSYGYGAAQTRYCMLGVGAFISADPGNSQAGTIAAGPTYAAVYLTGSGTGSMVAPLTLPQGATITGLELTAYDGDGATTTTAQGRVVAVAGNVGTDSVFNPATAWVAVPQGNAVVVRGTGTVSLGTVDNSTYTYFAEFQCPRTSNYGLVSFRVAYTVTQAE